MNRSRSKIHKEYNLIKEQISNLRKKLIELHYENLLFSDKNQWFIEKEEEVVISKKPKKTQKKLIGRVYWKQAFLDDDTNKKVVVERNEIVRVDGDWKSTPF